MKDLHLRLDHAGRPVVDVYVGMGEVLARLKGLLGEPVPQPRQLRALVDTGATMTVVEEGYLAGVGLLPVAEQLVHTASTGMTPLSRNVYAVELALAEATTAVLARNLSVIAVESLGGLGAQMLLGRDVLSQCVLTYDGPAGTLDLRIPDGE